jgi:hypothetical protein
MLQVKGQMSRVKSKVKRTRPFGLKYQAWVLGVMGNGSRATEIGLVRQDAALCTKYLMAITLHLVLDAYSPLP